MDIHGYFEVAITQIEVSITHLKMTEDDELSLRSTPSTRGASKNKTGLSTEGAS